MRKEVQLLSAMDSDNLQRRAALHKFRCDLDKFMMRARNAAMSLDAITDVCTSLFGSKDMRRDIASKLHAVVGALLFLSQLSHLPLEQSMLSPKEVAIISNGTVLCAPVLRKIEASEESLATYMTSRSHVEGSKVVARFIAFDKGEEVEAQRILQECLNTIVTVTIAVRTDYKDREAGRNEAKLPHQGPFTGLGNALLDTNTTPPTEPCRLFDSRPPSSRPLPQPQQYANQRAPHCGVLAVEEDRQPHTTAIMGEDTKKAETEQTEDKAPRPLDLNAKTTAPSDFTPASTRESTPAVEISRQQTIPKFDIGGAVECMRALQVSGKDLATEASTLNAVDWSNVSGVPGASKPSAVPKDIWPQKQDDTAPTVPTEGKKTTPKPLFSFGIPPPHLEAYILRPHVNTLDHSTIWSYKIEFLHLDNDAVQAHTSKLSPNYSIVNTVSELLPHELRLIQERTTSRNGQLVSVQHGVATDMVTHMGTFQVKPVIFVIKTWALPEKHTLLENTAALTQVSGPSQFTFTETNQNSAPPLPQPVSAATNSSHNLFSNIPRACNPFQASTFLTFQWSSVNAYCLPFVEPWFLEEKNGISSDAVQRYMTITFSDRHRKQDRSLEEIRLADYANGLTSPFTGGLSYPWENKPQIGMGRGNLIGNKPFGLPPFGAQQSCFGLNPAHTNTGQPFSKSTPGGGLFGSSWSSGGFVGSKPALGGSLFNNSSSTGQQPLPGDGPSGSLPCRSLFHGSPNHTCSGSGPFIQNTTLANSAFDAEPASHEKPSVFGTVPASRPSGGPFGFGQQPASSNQGLFNPPSAPPLNSGLFGNFATGPSKSPFSTAPAFPSGGLFGTKPPATRSTGLFGGSAAIGGDLFGAKLNTPSTGLFGSTPAPQSGGGLFGSAPATTTPDLFGGTSTSPSGGGCFGKAPLASFTVPSPSGGGTFGGAPCAQSSRPFGAARPSQPTTGGFGSVQPPAATLSSFCARPASTNPPSWAALSSTGTQAAKHVSRGLFGSASAAPGGFGSLSTTPNPFNNHTKSPTTASPSANIFAQATNTKDKSAASAQADNDTKKQEATPGSQEPNKPNNKLAPTALSSTASFKPTPTLFPTGFGQSYKTAEDTAAAERNRLAKNAEHDSDDETEEEWSARYDQKKADNKEKD